MSTPSDCKQCKESGLCKDKTGLPIFLTRYAIAPKKSPEIDALFEKGAPITTLVNPNTYDQRSYDISDAKAPALSGNFEVSDNILLGSGAEYSQRLLRSGYVYWVDNKNRWQAYFVTEDAFLTPIPVPSSPDDPAINTEKKPCNAYNYAKAAAITIPNPEQVDTIWIAFSDVEWTEDVWERHADVGYRNRHMRVFQVKEWVLNSLQQKHVAPIAELEKHVADYSGANENTFRFSPAKGRTPLLRRESFLSRNYIDIPHPNGEVLSMDIQEFPDFHREKVQAGEKWPMSIILADLPASQKSPAQQVVIGFDRILPGKGVIIALDDPVGIASDFSSLVNLWVDTFNGQEQYARGRAASESIVALRTAVYEEAKRRVIEWGDEEQFDLRLNLDQEDNRKYLLEKMHFVQETDWMKYEYVDYSTGVFTSTSTYDGVELTASDEHRARYAQWTQRVNGKKGADGKEIVVQKPNLPKRFFEENRKKFLEEADAKFASFETLVIKPLAAAHAKWLKSKTLANRFICNFSTVDPAQAGLYVDLLSRVIGTLHNQPDTWQVLLDWMNGKLTDEEDLLLRGCILNQDSLCTEVTVLSEKLEALKAEYKSLLEEMQRKANGPDADKPISPADRERLNKFEAIWTSNYSAASNAFDKVIANAYAITPVESGKASGQALAPVTPFNVLFAQISATALRHLEALPAGNSSHFTTTLNAIERTTDISTVIEGKKSALTESIAKKLANTQNMPGQKMNGLRGLIRAEVERLFSSADPTEKVAVRIRMDVAALSQIYNDPSITNREASEITRMVFGTMEFRATELNDVHDIHKLKSKENLLQHVRSQIATGKAAKLAALMDEMNAENERLRQVHVAEQERLRNLSHEARDAATNEQNSLQERAAQIQQRELETRENNKKLQEQYNRIQTIKGDAVAGVYSGISLAFSALALASIWKRLSIKPDWDNPLEVRTRFTVAAISTLGSLSDVVAKTTKAAEDYTKAGRVYRYAKSFNSVAHTKLDWISRRFGVTAAIGAAVLDISDGYKAYQSGNILLLGLYGTSAIIGVSAVIYQVATKVPKAPIVWGLLLATFAINQIIVSVREGEYHKYLERCAFGKDKANWTAKEEEENFIKATNL